MSENPTMIAPTAEGALAKALKSLPRVAEGVDVQNIASALTTKLSAKQAQYVAAYLETEFQRPILTANDLVPGGDAKPTYRGCLDPCEGATVGDLLKAINAKLGAVSG